MKKPILMQHKDMQKGKDEHAIKETPEQLKKQIQEASQKSFALDYAKNPPSITELFGAESIAEFEEILKQKNLFESLNNELDKTIVEETETRKTLLLIALGGRLTKNAAPTSTNLMVNDETGAGKDYIVNQVLKLLPDEWIEKVKRISMTSFTYLHNAKFEPDWTWDGMLFYNEDISNSILNCDVFKVMSSSDGINKSIITINNMAVDIITQGKPVMIITIASANPKREQLRRFPICNLNTTQEQTKKILKRKADLAKKGISNGDKYDPKIKQSLKYLKRVKVQVPFADKLVDVLNTKHIIVRTHFDRLIDYIKFSAAMHQYQRDIKKIGGQSSDEYVIAGPQDYDIARDAIIKTTSNIFSIPLTRNQQKILEITDALPKTKLLHSEETLEEMEQFWWYSVSDLEPKVTFISDRQLRRELDKLTEHGFLAKDKQDIDISKKPVMVYRMVEQPKMNIPTWKDIQNMSSVSSVSSMSNKSNVSNDGTNDTNDTNDKHIQVTEMQK